MTQNTTNSTEELCGFSEMPGGSFFIAVYSLIFVASLVLNSLAIYVYFCKPTNQSSITVYLKNLVIADLFVCLCLILRITKYASTSVDVQRIYCNFGAPASYLNMYSSILFMGYIAANRYMRIVRPLETQTLQTVRSTRFICMATWVGLLAFISVYIISFVSTNEKHNTHNGFDCDRFHKGLLKQIYLVMQTISFFTFLFVLICLIVFYGFTVQKLQKAQCTMPGQPGNIKLSKSKRNMKVLVVVFCVCFVPYHLLRLPYVFIKPLMQDCTAAQVFYILKELSVLLAVLNASLDPIIYFAFSKTFRTQLNFQRLFKSR